MPEISVLMCDRPRCQQHGEEWFIDKAGRRVRVLLCAAHSKPLVELAGYGEVVPIPVTPKSVRGLAESRLEALIVND